MRKAKWILFLMLLKFNPLYCQWQDSIVSTKYSPYFKDLLSRKGNIYVGVGKGKELVQLEHPHFNYRNQNLMKVGDRLYLYLFGTGILYVSLPPEKNDSLLHFKRIDRTYNADYNRGSFYYTYQGNIYNLGGYGFWRSNGINRIFNKDDGEWDVQPLSEEIIPDYNVNWHDTSLDQIYVPFQNFKNAATADEALIKGKIDPQSFILDLKSGIWRKNGRCNPTAIDMLINGSLHLHTKMGLWVLAFDNCYCFDFKHNKVFKLNDKPLAQAVSRTYAKQQHHYYYQGKIYFESMKDLKYDSLVVDPLKFVEEPYAIFEDDKTSILYYFGLGLLVLGGILYALRFRKNQAMPASRVKKASSLPKNIRLLFTETEMHLLEFMIEAMQEKQTASMPDINYILGVKDKNVGLQKKVRSDVINSINEKFKYLSKNELPLIQSIRSEKDKRYFEYQLSEVQYELLLKLMDSQEN